MQNKDKHARIRGRKDKNDCILRKLPLFILQKETKGQEEKICIYVLFCQLGCNSKTKN